MQTRPARPSPGLGPRFRGRAVTPANQPTWVESLRLTRTLRARLVQPTHPLKVPPPQFIFQRRSLRLREVDWLVQGHPAVSGTRASGPCPPASPRLCLNPACDAALGPLSERAPRGLDCPGKRFPPETQHKPGSLGPQCTSRALWGLDDCVGHTRPHVSSATAGVPPTSPADPPAVSPLAVTEPTHAGHFSVSSSFPRPQAVFSNVGQQPSSNPPPSRPSHPFTPSLASGSPRSVLLLVACRVAPLRVAQEEARRVLSTHPAGCPGPGSLEMCLQ